MKDRTKEFYTDGMKTDAEERKARKMGRQSQGRLQ